MPRAEPDIRKPDEIEDLVVEGNVVYDPYRNGTTLAFGQVNPHGSRLLGYMGKESFDEPTIEGIASVRFSSGERDQLVEKIREIAEAKGLTLEQRRYDYRTSHSHHLPPLDYQVFVKMNSDEGN